ncbi:amidohydrolase family protein [Bacteroidota bacterium]
MLSVLVCITIILVSSSVQAQVSGIDNKIDGSTTIADGYLSGGEFLIRNITVIDGLGSNEKIQQDIWIKDGKIFSIAPTGELIVSKSATVIEGTGLTAMPGLIDMHIHLKGSWTGGNILPDIYDAGFDDKSLQQTLAAFLYSGVTATLDVGNKTKFVVSARERIKRGEFIGPRYFATGMPFSQSPSGWDGAAKAEGLTNPEDLSVKIDTNDPEAIGKILDEYLENDIHIIKMYSGMSALAGTFLNNEAKKRGITTIADLWQLNMDHSWMQMTGLNGWAHSSPFEVSDLANKWMADNNRFIIATANVGEKMSGLRVKDDGDKQSFFNNPLVMDIWGKEVVQDFYSSYPEVRESLYEGPESFYQQYNFGDLSGFRKAFLINIKNAHDAGVLVAGGTDAPAYPSLWSGESMHRELELFVMAGIKPVEAIMMCSYNGAKILEKENEFGSLQTGLSADILIVEGKPWENISDTRNVEYVFLKGKLLDRQKLLTSWK